MDQSDWILVVGLLGALVVGLLVSIFGEVFKIASKMNRIVGGAGTAIVLVGLCVALYAAQSRANPGAPTVAVTPTAAATADSMTVADSPRPRVRFEVEVPADGGWIETPAFVRQGETVEIAYLSGSWSPWPRRSLDGLGCDPVLTSCQPPPGDSLTDQIAHAALIARMGDGTVLPIGNERTVGSPAPGPIFLRINDTSVDDNSGALSVAITVLVPAGVPVDVETVTVKADARGGTATGIVVEQGAVVEFMVNEETWCWGSGGDAEFSSADGTEGRPNEDEKPETLLPTGRFGQLVGKVGDSVFSIGSSGSYAMPGAGELHLIMNDRKGQNYVNNTGSMVVVVTRPV